MEKEPEKRKVGRPSRFKPEYCDLLIKHMKEGGSFESFGSIVNASKQTMYNWLESHPEFLDAKKLGFPYLAQFYEQMGKALASGQIRRVVSEEPMVDATGKPILDSKGNVLYKRTYAPTAGNATVWIFMCKNMLGWRDKQDIVIEDRKDKKTDDEIEEEYQQLLREALEEEKRLKKK